MAPLMASGSHGASSSGQSGRELEARKAKFGLDNPDRVEKIMDHGEQHYRSAHVRKRSTITYSNRRINVNDLIGKVQDQLDDSRHSLTCLADPLRTFIPRETFAQILSPEVVLQIVQGLDCCKNIQDKQRLAQDIFYGTARKPSYAKILGALIASELEEEILEYMEEGLSDNCLPLRLITADQNASSSKRRQHLVCRHRHNHKIVNSYRRFDKTQNFFRWTCRLIAPFITWKSDKHFHYIFEKGHSLPMEICEQHVPIATDTHGNAHGEHGDGKQDAWLYGGFSKIFKVKIPESHCNFDTRPVRNNNGYYALKQLTSNNRLSFNLELSSLLFSADQEGSKKHLVQLLATFEEYNPIDRTSTFFLLFDWAQGDLNAFWKANPGLVRNEQHCYWMAQQFHGLAEALTVVHNDRQANLKHLPEEVTDTDLYGRHGDIKPGNVLCFGSSKQTQSLALADFGLGRLHSKVSRSKQDPTLLQRDATYRAPEFDMPNGLISPVSDVFSLGCVFLEYISWYLLGLEAVVDKFSDLRLEKDIHSFEADTFFRVSKGKDNRSKPELKPAVKQWIEQLRGHSHCTAYIHQMLDLVEKKMLEPRREDRIRALPLAKELRTIRTTCERTPSFYLERTNSTGSGATEVRTFLSNALSAFLGKALLATAGFMALFLCSRFGRDWKVLDDE